MFPLLFMRDKQPLLVDQIAEKLPMSARGEFMKHVNTKVFHKGDKLVSRGQVGTYVWFLQAGLVEVVGLDFNGVPFRVCTIGPGNSIGQSETIAPAYTDIRVTSEEAILQYIRKEDFIRITAKQSDSVETFLEAQHPEFQVFLAAQGQGATGFTPRAEKGTGKTRHFATLNEEEKLQVLSYTGLEEARKFRGRPMEGRSSSSPTSRRRSSATPCSSSIE